MIKGVKDSAVQHHSFRAPSSILSSGYSLWSVACFPLVLVGFLQVHHSTSQKNASRWKDRHPFQGVFPPYAQYSWDRLWIHPNHDQDKDVTEWLIEP